MYERRGALDLKDVDHRTDRDHERVVVRTGGPQLAVDPDPARVTRHFLDDDRLPPDQGSGAGAKSRGRSEEHTSELQSHLNLVCRLLLEKKKTNNHTRAR